MIRHLKRQFFYELSGPSLVNILHLGSGRVGKHLSIEGEITTLDADPRLEPDVVCRLGVDRLRFPDNTFDLVIAIHILEHIGVQGDTTGWFQFWEEIYRVTKPDGQLQFESPRHDSVWAWADPSHTRALSRESFAFFDQDSYRISKSSISPYRIRCDWVGEMFRPWDTHHFRGVLRARKPFRPWWED